jgi:hypothetical protein|nr:hypothetical protein [Cressdnaviricota sp.]
MDKVKITKTCALWLIEHAKQLVNDGYGSEWVPGEPYDFMSSDTPGFIDDIPIQNGDLWRYVNSLINFARSVGAIIANNMREGSPLDTLLITHGEDISEL